MTKNRRETDVGLERILAKAEELNERQEREHRSALRRMLRSESTPTLMLGVSSLTLAIVMTMTTVLGLFGMKFRNWSEPHRLEDSINAGTFAWSATAATSRTIYLPSDDCTLLAFVGLFLGGIGIALSLHRRKFSWLSAAGFTLILLMMLVVVASGMILPLR